MLIAGAGLLGAAALSRLSYAGTLTPPAGAIGPTPGPQPRTPITQQTCPGDSGAVHVISAPGAYYLTGNLNHNGTRAGIRIDADNVDLDLMGFSISSPMNLGNPAADTGVRAPSTSRRGIRVHNGSISATSYGVFLRGSGHIVENLRVGVTRNDAVYFDQGLAQNVCVWSYGSAGVWANASSSVRNCGVSGSVGTFTTGISAYASCVEHCAVAGVAGAMNASKGISVYYGTVRGCAASDFAGGHGIYGQGSRIEDCVAANGYTGLYATTSHLTGCMAVSCTSSGITSNSSIVDSCSCVDCSTGFIMNYNAGMLIRCMARNCTTPYSLLGDLQSGVGLIIDARQGYIGSGVVPANNPFANWIC